MEMHTIPIGGSRFTASEIDILHLLLEDDDPDWTVAEIAASLPYTTEDVWADVQSLILSGMLTRTDMSQSIEEDIEYISLTVPAAASEWIAEHQQDIDAAFIVLNPDMFDVTEVAEA
jgi:hypothetical protein